MFRICKIARFVTKNVRPSVILQIQNQSETQRFIIAQRFYSKQKDDKPCRKTEPNKHIDKSKGVDCVPKETKSCKPPDFPPCPKKESSIPSLQVCTKPNLMSELPKPDCAWEAAAARARRRNRAILILGLLLATLTLAALLYSLRDKSEKGPKIKVVKKKKKETRKILKNVPVKIPSDASEIPKEVPYLLIGGGTASFSAFRAIKSADPLAKVLVVSSDGYYPYMRPPLSKELWFNDDPESVRKLEFKQWNGSQRSLFYEPDDFYIACKDLLVSENGGVSVARGWTISHVDVVERIAYLEEGHPIKYDKCLIATGATPRNLLVFKNAEPKIADNVTLYRNVYDFEAINSSMDQVKSIAIIGGSFLGSELACALGRKVKKDPNFKVYQIFKEAGNMGKILPEYLSYWTTDKVKAEGVEVLANSEVTAAEAVTSENEADRVKLTLNNGRHLNVDRVIVAIGVEPNTVLAEKSDLEVDPELGGFLANTELQARSDLYVAGDCVCFYDVKLGRRRVEHHDHAVITGRLAGENMTGGRKPYLHQSMFWSDLGPDVGYEAIGIVDSTLPTVGVFAKATDKDNPKAVVTTTDEGLRSSSENEIPEECKKYVDKQALSESNKLAQESRREASKAREGEDFGKGVIFYLRDDIVVGIVLWNVFNRMQIARQVLSDERKYEDLNEVAKLFNIHEE